MVSKSLGTKALGFAQEYGILIALVIIVLVPSVFSDNFLTFSNGVNILRQVAFNGILALGMGFVITTGGIDLSVGSVLALSAVVAAGMSVQDGSPQNIFVAIVCGLLVAAVVGLINGLLVTKASLAPFIATLATMTIARGAAQVITNGRPVIGYTSQYQSIGQGQLLGVPLPVWYFVVAIIVVGVVMHRSRFGRHVYAVGGNEVAARASGVRVDRVKIAVYMISAVMAGIAGIALSSRVNAASPIAGVGYELDAIAAVVIGGTSMSGGKGRVVGTVIGALIIGVISNALDILNVSAYYQQIIKGLVIVVAVMADRSRKNL